MVWNYIFSICQDASWFDYSYFIPFYYWGPKILHMQFEVILSKIEGKDTIFVIYILSFKTGGPKGFY